MSHAEVVFLVEALPAPTHPVGGRRALRLHLLVLGAEVVAVDTPGQVVPQLGELVGSAGRAGGGRGGGAVRGHVRAGRTLVTDEGLPGARVQVLEGGDGYHRGDTAEDGREQEELR